MAQRLSISVPDDLAAQVKSFKSKLNVSRICQEAIMQAIEMVELKDRSQQDLDVLKETGDA